MSDKTKAEELKNQGNSALQQGKTEEAINLYSQAIEIDSSNVALYTNRSAAYVKSGSFDKALQDAEKAVQLNPNGRAYQRKAVALYHLGRFPDSIEAYKQGLSLEPENAQLKSGLADAQRSLAAQQQRGKETEGLFKTLEECFKGDLSMRVKSMPETSHLVDDKEFMKKLELIQRDPSKLPEHLQDARVKTFISSALQYQAVSQMSNEERAELVRKQEEMKMRQEKREEEERERKRKEEKAREEAEAKKKKEEELAKLTPDQRKALEIKDEANKKYNLKDFSGALALYHEASALDPTNIVYFNNIAAALLELKEFDKVIETCEKALEIGRQNRAAFELVARTLQRLGTAHARKGDLARAIEFYQKSLTEHRDGQTLTLLRKVEKQYEEQQRQAYVNPELSVKAKEEGNTFFRNSNFAEAEKCYTEAIKRNPSDHTLYTNRAQAYIKLMALPEAMKDCEHAISLKPDFVKAYQRKGQVHFMMKEYQKCLKTYEQALEYDPENVEVADAINKTIAAINAGIGKQDAETVRRNVENDPELQSILTDPLMQQVLKDLQNDPQSFSRYMRDPQIKKNIEKLVQAGILGTKSSSE